MTTNNEIFDRLGQLTAEMKAVSEHLSRQDQKSEASRANMHRRLDEVVLRVGYLESDMNAVKTTTSEVKVVTDEVVEWKQRGMGALAVIGIGGAVLGGMTVWFWGQILAAIRGV